MKLKHRRPGHFLIFCAALGGVVGGPAHFGVQAARADSSSHQYSWSDWLPLNDGRSNGISFSFRKGDNNFMERGLVFIRLKSRYESAKISGNVEFTVVNSNSGEESKTQNQYFSLKPGEVRESQGAFFNVPGKNSDPDEWQSRRLRITNIRVLNFTLK